MPHIDQHHTDQDDTLTVHVYFSKLDLERIISKYVGDRIQGTVTSVEWEYDYDLLEGCKVNVKLDKQT